MKMDKVAGSGNDEFYTPMYAVDLILKYIKFNSTIWCPFDTDESMFVKRFRYEGHSVINTHINTGNDFFETSVPECDYIISNPPYSRKADVFKRLFDIGIPFAMLVGVAGLFEADRFYMFRDNSFEIMYMNKRVSYLDKNGRSTVNPPFSSVYICKDMLPDRIIFEEINRKKRK